ncbi:MAG: alpha/beta hydrolase [Bacteroidetes bacterium]|nr:alpha/beta hydrolase [Bacteroidota bacterium]
MKKIVLLLCLIALSIINLPAQKVEINSCFSVDTGYINVDGGILFYEAAGSGENIVLVHDGLIHHHIWDNQFQMLANNYHVIRYDRRGYGKSSIPQDNFSNVDDLNKLFEQLKIDKAIIFGMSAGGGLTIDFTLKYPEKVNAIVLVGSVVSGLGFTDHMFTRGGHLDPSLSPYNDLHKWLMYFAKDDPYEIYYENSEAKEKIVKYIEDNEPGVLARLKYTLPPERPAVKNLSEIKIPTLILTGEFDIPGVHVHAGAIEAGIANSKRFIIPKSGHLIPLEQPEIFNETVLNFLKLNL